jgi:NFU1 iron-sulfur cluster scaffold homolog, mitochondrial
MFIQTERTPNPNALKLTPDVALTLDRPWATDRASHAPGRSPLSDRLLALPWVERVFIEPRFVTVTRTLDAADWSLLRPEAIMALADHLASGLPAVLASVAPSPPVCESGDLDEEIQTVMARFLQPGVSRDGGEIGFVRFDAAAGVLWIEMRGACGGCPSSRSTLKGAVETTVRRYVPEVLRVEDIADGPLVETASPRLAAWRAALGGSTAKPTPTLFTHNGRSMGRDGR